MAIVIYSVNAPVYRQLCADGNMTVESTGNIIADSRSAIQSPYVVVYRRPLREREQLASRLGGIAL